MGPDEGSTDETIKDFDEKHRLQLKFLDYAPLLHISALTGERTPKLLETVDRVADGALRRIPTGELNRFVEAVTATHAPVSPASGTCESSTRRRPASRRRRSCSSPTSRPTFHFSYERFLTNRLRESFGFEGTPIRLEVRARRREEKRR